jgi:16S rRNA (cytosine967-C5)-methyltransferase
VTARDRALQALLATRTAGSRPVEEELAARLGGLSGRDRALARELVAGTIRHRASLDAVINHLSRDGRCRTLIREILRLALYQLLFLERIPDHAATNAAVQLTRRREPRAAGYVNAILRGAVRQRQPAASEDPGALVGPAGRAVRIEGLLVPGPDQDPAGNLALRYSYPRELVAHWLERHGPATTEAILRAGNTAPQLHLRVNPRITTREAYRERLAAAGVAATPGESPHALRLEGFRGEVTRLPGFEAGACSVQGPVAQRVVERLAPEGASCIVDLCAAPGGKATAILERCDASAEVHCVDVDQERLSRLQTGVERLRLPAPRLWVGDAREFTLPEARLASRVLVDVPCSNTGVLGRRLEARWRFSAAAVAELAQQAAGLLAAGLRLVAPGGRVVYATCSLVAAENEGALAAAREEVPGWEITSAEELLPHEQGGDGGFVAVLERG